MNEVCLSVCLPSELVAFALGVLSLGAPMGVLWLIHFMRERREKNEAENTEKAEGAGGQASGAK